MFPPLADRLARAGFTAVSLNVSGSGVDDGGAFAFPERFGHNTFSAELGDLGVVIDALASGSLGVPAPAGIGVLGHSRGGGVAILRAAADARLGALVTWASIATVRRWGAAAMATWRATGRQDVVNARTGEVLPLYTDVLDDIDAHGPALDIEAAAARVAVPWLLVHGSADEAVPVEEAEHLAALQPRLELERIEGAGHTFGARHPWAGSTPELDRAMARSIAWFATHLT
jgi:dienelactone hydrolase